MKPEPHIAHCTLHLPLGLYLAGFEGHEASARTNPIPGLGIAQDSVFHQDVFDLFVGGDLEASSQTRHVESDHVCRIVVQWVHWASGPILRDSAQRAASKFCGPVDTIHRGEASFISPVSRQCLLRNPSPDTRWLSLRPKEKVEQKKDMPVEGMVLAAGGINP